MDILRDIRDILIKNKNTEHFLKIEVSFGGVTVYLDYDPERGFEEKCVIPITHDVLDGITYIPNVEFKEKYNPCDYGIEYEEIVLIKEIMEYLNDHAAEINELCVGYDFEDRKP